LTEEYNSFFKPSFQTKQLCSKNVKNSRSERRAAATSPNDSKPINIVSPYDLLLLKYLAFPTDTASNILSEGTIKRPGRRGKPARHPAVSCLHQQYKHSNIARQTRPLRTGRDQKHVRNQLRGIDVRDDVRHVRRLSMRGWNRITHVHLVLPRCAEHILHNVDRVHDVIDVRVRRRLHCRTGPSQLQPLQKSQCRTPRSQRNSGQDAPPCRPSPG